MAPYPRAETSRPLLPSVRFCILLLLLGHQITRIPVVLLIQRTAVKRHFDACFLIRRIASLNPSGVPLDPARRRTFTSSMRFPTTTAGTAAAKRRCRSRDVGLVA